MSPDNAPMLPPRIGTRASAAVLATDLLAVAETLDPYSARIDQDIPRKLTGILQVLQL